VKRHRFVAHFASLVLGAVIAADVPAAEQVASAESVSRAIAAAEAARREAAVVGAEWLETGALIEQARTAETRGDWAEALEQASRARHQGELAIAQAKREATAWRHRVVR
jgi:hypothetical protein